MNLNLTKIFNAIVFTGFFSIVCIQPFLLKIYGLDNSPNINLIDDYVYLFYLVSLIPLLGNLLRNKLSRNAIYAYLFFLMLGIVSTYMVNYSKSRFQMVLQIILDFKMIVFLFVFYFYVPSKKEIKRFEIIIKAILIAGIPLCILQYLKPDLYISIFQNEINGENFSPDSINLPRLTGYFPIAGYTAFFTSITSYYFLSINKNKIFAVLSLIQLVITFQRQEIVTFILLFFWIDFKYNSGHIVNKVKLIISILLLFAIYYLKEIRAYIKLTLDSMSFNRTIQYSEDPRVLVYFNGIILAIKHFPFGVGFGNYGGFAAEKFDTILYYQLNFYQQSWFKDKDYLTDTYYPHLFAESGILGFSFYLICLIFIYKMFKSRINEMHIIGAITFLLLYLFVDAITAPVLNSPISLCLIGFVLSIVRKKNKLTPVKIS